MNRAQIQEVNEVLAQVKEYQFIEQFNAAFPDQDFSTVILDQEFTVAEAIPLLSRILLQLEDALNSDLAICLPYKLAIPEIAEYQLSWCITDALKVIRDYMPRPDGVKSVGSAIKWLVYYQLFCGFWDKSERKLHFVDEIKLKQQQQELDLLQRKISETLSGVEAVAATHAANFEKIADLIRVKTEEFSGLSNMVGKATNESSLITQLWEQSHRQAGEIDNLKSQSNQVLDSIRRQLSEQQNEFKQLNESVETGKTNLTDTIVDALSKLSYLEKSKDLINERLKEATDLLGLSADAALGGKFNKRETDVRKSLIWWRVAIGVSVVAAIIWAICVFNKFPSNTKIPYLDILVNLVKTSPGFILMGYIMAQYNKERVIEEEYAFKAAIAMTINAYANLLKDSDKEENKSRQQMLLDAIRQVYAKPQMHKENVSARTYKNATVELIDVLKSLKG